MMFLMLLVAQATAAPATPPAPAAKPKQICEMREVTGSRSKKRVCRDATGRLDLGPGIKDGGGNISGQAPTSSGGSTPN
jgi:hypothetical protein